MKITQELVNKALLKVGTSLLKKEYRDEWSETNPTFGYCYTIAEIAYHFTEANEINAYCISLDDGDTHWYVIADGKLLDFTAEQFQGEPIPYHKAKKKGFFKGSIKTNRGYISKRAYQIAKIIEKLGVTG